MGDTKQWTSKSMGTRFGHNFFYLMVKIGGRRAAYFVLYFIVFYYVIFHQAVKIKTEPYLTRRFPKTSGIKRILQRYQLVLNFGKALVDRAILGILGQASIHMDFEYEADIKKIRSLNSGFILLMSHVGCWQGVMSALPELGKPVNLLMYRDEQDIDKHYFEHGQKGTPFNIINPDQFLGGTIEMLKVLQNDEILCIMGDRVFKSAEFTIKVDFLGKPAGFPLLAYKMASISGKPIVVLHSHKRGPDQYSLSIPEIIYVRKKLGKDRKVYMPYVTKFIASLEAYTQRFPYQFFNFYDMWKESVEPK
ncbi:MAG: lysophospholipid acyltransferase family protein [Desulfamplus sp.]|nr:lysophospholipid acyltransferase family protein [Desulfamplus sp.]